MQDFIFVRTFKGHSDKVTSVAFSADGQILASGSGDKTVKIWHLAKNEPETLKGHGESSWSGGVNSVVSGLPLVGEDFNGFSRYYVKERLFMPIDLIFS